MRKLNDVLGPLKAVLSSLKAVLRLVSLLLNLRTHAHDADFPFWPKTERNLGLNRMRFGPKQEAIWAKTEE